MAHTPLAVLPTTYYLLVKLIWSTVPLYNRFAYHNAAYDVRIVLAVSAGNFAGMSS